MKKIKITILYSFKNGPWGGANQFLKAVRGHFISMGVYTDSLIEADVILFNSSPSVLLFNHVRKVYNIKKKYPNKIVINRIDGPVSRYRKKNKSLDCIFYLFSECFCNGTIFQSNWSRLECIKDGMNRNTFGKVIINAPDKKLFNCCSSDIGNKVKIIIVSWSSNWNKGFNVYKWLDENLNFDKYVVTFVGNSPIIFKNIITKEPMTSCDLSLELKDSNIYLSASKIESCSNSLLEALHCGLPSLCCNSSSNPEIIKNGGEVYNNKSEIPKLLERMTEDYKNYCSNTDLPEIDEIGNEYYKFITNTVKKSDYKNLRKISIYKYLNILRYFIVYKFEERFLSIKTRFFR